MRKNTFLLFLISQGISNFGDTLQLIAVTTLLINITGTGLAAGFGLLSTPISSVLLSLLAGGLGDRSPEKYILTLLGLIKGLVVFLFINNPNVWTIYCLLLIISSLNILYNPPSKRLVKSILQNDDVIIGNSLLNGVSGFSYLLGPLIAGIIIKFWGLNVTFIISSISFLISGVMLVFVKNNSYYIGIFNIKKRQSLRNELYTKIKEGFRYWKNTEPIREMIILNAVTSFGIASVNFAFYSLAFDIMGVTSEVWGFMLSVFYGTNLIAMFISILCKRRINKTMELFLYSSLLFICGGWLCYGFARDLPTILILLISEGTFTAIFSILLVTELQINAKESFMARITGINDILGSISKLLGILSAFILQYLYSIRHVFIINSLMLFIYTIYKLLGSTPRSFKTLP